MMNFEKIKNMERILYAASFPPIQRMKRLIMLLIVLMGLTLFERLSDDMTI